MAIKDIVGAEQYENMRQMLQSAFPDPKTVVTDAAVDAAFQIAKHEWNAATLTKLFLRELVKNWKFELASPPAWSEGRLTPANRPATALIVRSFARRSAA